MIRTTTFSAIVAVLACVTSAAGQAADAKISGEAAYSECMALVRKSPQDGYEQALAWLGNNGGAPAWHCAAVGLIGLEKYDEAASSLEKLGDELAAARPDLAAGLYGQAGQAWTLAGDVKRAYAAQTAGLKLAPDDPDLLTDRAITNASLNNYKAAVEDLNQANRAAPKRADVLTYRATAWRYLNDLKQARADADAALKLAPDDPDALLERGIIRRLADDKKGALADWKRVIAVAPDTPTAGLAQDNLAKLDIELN